MEHSQAHPVHIDKSTSTTTIVAKPIATAATTTATLTPAPAADTFIKSLLPQLSSSHDNNILNIIPSTGDADDPGYINTNDNINNHRIIPHTPCINNSYFIADNNNYEPSISSPLSPLTPLTPLPTPILSTPYILPLLLNLSGSIVYYYTLGQSDLSLAIPITNSLTFIFTTLAASLIGEEIGSKETWIGMGLVVIGVGLCVDSKVQ
ncbi:10723_t:CDS:2 [Entrophospora sp. SA101]|nr:10723_t:CDS:2 [Entrophospora sp. SA101]